MKKIITIVLIIVVVIVAALVAIPVFFKQDLLNYAQNTLNKQLNAKVELADLKLSLFREFPNLSLELRDVSVTGGQGQFASDTLFSAKVLRTTTNLKSLFHPSDMQIKEIVLDKANIHLISAETGEVNWDLAAGEETAANDDTEGENDFRMQLDKIEIRDAVLKYDDLAANMHVLLDDIDFDISGEMYGSVSQLSTDGNVGNFSLDYDGTNYIANTTLGLKTLLDVDFDKMLFTIAENELLINRLPLELSGKVEMPNDSIQMDLELTTKNSDFENFIALVPPVYEEYLKDIKTTGTATIKGSVKGFYFEEDYPAINLQAKVANGNFKYAEMPEDIKNIRAQIDITKPQGELDEMKIKVSDAHAEIRNNPMDLLLTVSNPVSDPYFDAALVGKVNLSHLKNALPMDSVNMSGVIDANIMAQGRFSAIEKEEYQNIKSDGAVLLNNFVYQSPTLTKEIIIPQGKLDFSPQKIDLSQFKVLIGQSDFNLSGSVSDYLAYLFSKGTLNGDLRLDSKHANLNELLRLQVSEDEQPEDVENEVLAFDIPPRINFKLRSDIKTAVINRIPIKDIKGLIKAENEKLTLENLDMNLLEGTLTMNGSYQNTPQDQPLFDFGIDISKIDIPAMYSSLVGIRKMMPMAGNSTGKISTDLGLKGRLNQQLGLITKSLDGKGTFSTSNLQIVDSPVFNQLSGILNKEKLRNIKVDDFMANINIEDGNLLLKPFTTKVIGQETTVQGSLNADNLIDMRLDFMVERDAFGPDIQKVLAVIPGNEKIKVLPAGVNITGPVGEPKVSPDLSKTTKAITDATKDDLKNSLDKLGKGILKMFEK